MDEEEKALRMKAASIQAAIDRSKNSNYEIAHGEPLTDGFINSFIPPHHTLCLPVEAMSAEDHRRFVRIGELYQSEQIDGEQVAACKATLCLYHPRAFLVSDMDREEQQKIIDERKAAYQSFDEVTEFLDIE